MYKPVELLPILIFEDDLIRCFPLEFNTNSDMIAFYYGNCDKVLSYFDSLSVHFTPNCINHLLKSLEFAYNATQASVIKKLQTKLCEFSKNNEIKFPNT